MTKTPIAQVKEQFQSKEKLVAAVEKLAKDDLWVDRVNGTKGLARVSNAKLLKLHEQLSRVKKEFGSRGKLVAAILELEKRGKDAGYKQRLEGYTVPRLLDVHATASRRAKRAANKPAAPKKKKVARSKKAQAKVRAAG